MRKLWITGCIVMICMGMLTACGGNKTEVVPIGDTEEADREVPYAMYINRVEGGKVRNRFSSAEIYRERLGGCVDVGSQL